MSTTEEEDDEDLAAQGILNEFKPKISPLIAGRAWPSPIIIDGHEVEPPPRLPRREPMSEEDKEVAVKAAFMKRLNKFTLSGIVSTAMGLPGRLRQLYHRIEKIQKTGKGFGDVLDDIQPIVSK